MSIWEDWSGRGSHVDFKSDETIPLVQGRFLGHGAMGGVYETHCKGVALAWKRRFCRKRIGDKERKEIEILKKLSHRHIIQLVGTYTHKQFLGLLLYPVAVCDLATFFEDIETLHSGQPLDLMQEERFQSLGLPYKLDAYNISAFLYGTIGCLASAIEYLHSQQIRHKDLKPSNILLSRGRLWLTDFGSATDFSTLSQSATENGERGTPKYFAPEVAQYRPNGRAADIFSLGCIYLEIATLFFQGNLRGLKELRPSMDTSFQANLHRSRDWFKLLQQSASPRYRHLLLEIELMLVADPELRPSATTLHKRLLHIDHFKSSGGRSLFGSCCSVKLMGPDEVELAVQQRVRDIEEHRESERRVFQARIKELENHLTDALNPTHGIERELWRQRRQSGNSQSEKPTKELPEAYLPGQTTKYFAPLPEHWIVKYNADTDAFFFFNDITRETTIHDPRSREYPPKREEMFVTTSPLPPYLPAFPVPLLPQHLRKPVEMLDTTSPPSGEAKWRGRRIKALKET
jgi:serine/threonine protein kinase